MVGFTHTGPIGEMEVKNNWEKKNTFTKDQYIFQSFVSKVKN